MCALISDCYKEGDFNKLCNTVPDFKQSLEAFVSVLGEDIARLDPERKLYLTNLLLNTNGDLNAACDRYLDNPCVEPQLPTSPISQEEPVNTYEDINPSNKMKRTDSITLTLSLEDYKEITRHKCASILIRTSQPFSKVMKKLAPILNTRPAYIRLRSWDGSSILPNKTPLDYDLEDGDKIDMEIRKSGFEQRAPSFQENINSPVNPSVFQDRPKCGSLTDGDEALAQRLQEEWDREAALTHQKELEILLGSGSDYYASFQALQDNECVQQQSNQEGLPFSEPLGQLKKPPSQSYSLQSSFQPSSHHLPQPLLLSVQPQFQTQLQSNPQSNPHSQVQSQIQSPVPLQPHSQPQTQLQLQSQSQPQLSIQPQPRLQSRLHLQSRTLR
eukprot:TRINITY_DN7545_c0_g2_i3.p1 TRINITY_DN7545_c0_g2~~TRINITY_DN7545_c0_g2_i3.p1  ORF type:complete len:399 (+),score=71.57 TRINITY_DN7545_c0_g2_i3:42-1199(+)